MAQSFPDQFRRGPSPLSDDSVRLELQRAILNNDSAAFRAVLQSSHPALAGQHRLYGVLVMTSDGMQPVLVDETGERLGNASVIEVDTPIDLLNVQHTDGEMAVHTTGGVWLAQYDPGQYRLGHIAVYKLCSDPDRDAPDVNEVATALRMVVGSADTDLPVRVAKAELEPHWVLPCELTVHYRTLPLDRSLLDQEAASEHTEYDLYSGYDVQFRTVSDSPTVRQFRVYLFCCKQRPTGH